MRKEANVTIRKLRRKRGWTITRLAKECGCSTTTIVRMEKSEASHWQECPPRINTLILICKILGVRVNDLEF